MFSRIWLVNLLLAAGVLFLVYKAVGVWHEEDRTPQTAIERKAKKNETVSVKKAFVRRVPDESAYDAVVDKNLFSQEREESVPEEKEEETAETKTLMEGSSELALHGVIIMGDYKAALIRNLKKDSPRKRGGQSAGDLDQEQWKSIGDKIAGYDVSDILQDRVFLSGKAGDMELLLYDKNKLQKPAFRVKITASKPQQAPAAKPPSGEPPEGIKPPSGDTKGVAGDYDTVVRKRQPEPNRDPSQGRWSMRRRR